MAKSHPYDTSADALLNPAKNVAFFVAWQPADTDNHDLLCAEMARLAYATEPVVRPALAAIGFNLVGMIGGESFSDRRANHGTQGFVAEHAALGLSVLAFRGTESGKFEDLISDLSTHPVAHPTAGRVHGGFWRAYLPVKNRLAALLASRQRTLLITGHSLGAALATLAAADLAPTALITFGSPRVGDRAFGTLLAPAPTRPPISIRRFVGCCDVVTRVPPEAFDEAHLSTLFAELGDFARLNALLRDAAQFAAHLAARALALPFSRLNRPVEFDHVSPPCYLAADGTRHDAPSAEFQQADQLAARAAYPHSARQSLDQLIVLFRGLGRSEQPGTARDFFRSLFALLRGDPVPLRDLADHAPINYVSGLAGRSGRTER